MVEAHIRASSLTNEAQAKICAARIRSYRITGAMLLMAPGFAAILAIFTYIAPDIANAVLLVALAGAVLWAFVTGAMTWRKIIQEDGI